MHPVDSPALEGPAELRLHGRGRLLHEVEEAVLEHLKGAADTLDKVRHERDGGSACQP